MAGIKELTEAVAERCGLSKMKAREVICELFCEIVDRGRKGERVVLQNFGVFSQKTRAARTARNPGTGEKVQVPEKKVLTFKAS